MINEGFYTVKKFPTNINIIERNSSSNINEVDIEFNYSNGKLIFTYLYHSKAYEIKDHYTLINWGEDPKIRRWSDIAGMFLGVKKEIDINIDLSKNLSTSEYLPVFTWQNWIDFTHERNKIILSKIQCKIIGNDFTVFFKIPSSITEKTNGDFLKFRLNYIPEFNAFKLNTGLIDRIEYTQTSKISKLSGLSLIDPYYDISSGSNSTNFGHGIVLRISNITNISYEYNKVLNSSAIRNRKLIISYKNNLENILTINLNECSNIDICKLDFDNISSIEHEYKSGLRSVKHYFSLNNLSAFINVNLSTKFNSRNFSDAENIESRNDMKLSDEDYAILKNIINSNTRNNKELSMLEIFDEFTNIKEQEETKKNILSDNSVGIVKESDVLDREIKVSRNLGAVLNLFNTLLDFAENWH